MKRAHLLTIGLTCGVAALVNGALVLRDMPALGLLSATAQGIDTRMPSMPMASPGEPEAVCPPGNDEARAGITVEGVEIAPSTACVADDPYVVAASVLGTNNVSEDTLMRSGLSRDAVIKGRDGDPNYVEIHLEVAELNGFNPDGGPPLPGYAIAPGIKPGFWTFAPKHRGMSTVSSESSDAGPLLRMPPPSIRVKVGDTLRIVLENTHYLPHTIHLHGVDHPYLNSAGEGNDGVPMFGEEAVQPGESRVYEAKLRHAGTMYYHCHVDEQAHVPMGLAGMIIVEEKQAETPVQTLNIGAGEVRYRSGAVRSAGYAGEHDLVYGDVLRGLNSLLSTSNNARVIERHIQQDFNVTQAQPEYFLLNGRAFPYTLRESMIAIEPGQRVKLHVLDASSEYIALHTHGHKVLITHQDGVAVPPGARTMRDVVDLMPGQRVDLDLDATDDGLHSYGPGLWMIHDHRPKAVTNNGIGHGGSMTFLAYPGFLDTQGIPRAAADLAKLFVPGHYATHASGMPMPDGAGSTSGFAGTDWAGTLRMVALPLLLTGMLVSFGSLFRRRRASTHGAEVNGRNERSPSIRTIHSAKTAKGRRK
ncbi:multicopper oxidase domain-containing protein [Skermanella aerolata]|nr:multicopper oxidase domain-containing protein [Skermanella aerolata]